MLAPYINYPTDNYQEDDIEKDEFESENEFCNVWDHVKVCTK